MKALQAESGEKAESSTQKKIEGLLHTYATARDSRTKQDVINELGRFGKPAAAALVELFFAQVRATPPGHPDEYIGFIDPIKKMGKHAVPALLAWGVADKNRDVRLETAYLLGFTNDAKAFEGLLKMVLDPDGGVRIAVATSLGWTGDRKAVPVLMGMLMDNDRDVRFYAARSLGSLGDSRALGALRSSAKLDSEDTVREEARKAIESIGKAASGRLKNAKISKQE